MRWLIRRFCSGGNTPLLARTDAVVRLWTHDIRGKAVVVDKQRRLDETIDKLRARYGRKAVYFGSGQESRETAPMHISFTPVPDLE